MQKFAKVNLENEKIKERVGDVPGGAAVLRKAGFAGALGDTELVLDESKAT